MANTISPFGAQDFMHQGGSQRTEELQTAWIASSDATPIFNGDLIQSAFPVSSALLTGGYGNYVTQGTSGAGPWRGVFRGCEFYNATVQRMQYSRFWPGSGVAGTSSQTGDVKAFIVADPNQRFVIQASSQGVIGSSMMSGAFSVSVGGTVGGVSSAGGNTVTGLSGMQLTSSTYTVISAVSSATGIYPFRLVGFLSNHGAGAMGTPGTGSSLAFVNGMDNTSVGQIVIVEPLWWESKQI